MNPPEHQDVRVGGSPTSYRMLRGWARSAVWYFYRDVAVTAERQVAGDRPTIFAANHSNALGDVAVLIANTPRFPRFLATATWWDRAAARLLFRLGGVLPVDRARDGSDAHHNSSTFAACRSALESGEHIAIFPEGELNVGPALLPIKTGAARIGLSAADAGIRGVVIEPVGLVYEDRGRFRSSVEINFGEPIEIDEWVDRYRDDPTRTVHDVTDVLAARLAAVTVNSDAHETVTLVRRAVTMVLADSFGDTGGLTGASVRSELSRRLVAALEGAEDEDDGDGVRSLEAAVAAHADDLARLGFDETQPLEFESESMQNRRLTELVLLSPAAAVGAVATSPVVVGVTLAGRLVNHEGWQATILAAGGTFLLPVIGALEIAYGSRRFGVRRAAAFTVAGVASSIATIYWVDRMRQVRNRSLTTRALLDRWDDVAHARESRAEVVRQVHLLAPEVAFSTLMQGDQSVMRGAM